MHDAAMHITPYKLMIYAGLSFFGAALVQLLSMLLRAKSLPGLYISHFLISLIAFALFAFEINKPCGNINSEHYMLVDTIGVVASYFLGIAGYLLLIISAFLLVMNLLRKQEG